MTEKGALIGAGETAKPGLSKEDLFIDPSAPDERLDDEKLAEKGGLIGDGETAKPVLSKEDV